MMAARHATFATHVVRLVISLVLSIVTLVVMLLAVRASSALQSFSWYVLPLSVAAGFAPDHPLVQERYVSDRSHLLPGGLLLVALSG